MNRQITTPAGAGWLLSQRLFAYGSELQIDVILSPARDETSIPLLVYPLLSYQKNRNVQRLFAALRVPIKSIFQIQE